MQSSPSVEFDAEYRPLIAGGVVGKYASEIYPVRVDAHGTHQLACAFTKQGGPIGAQQFVIDRLAESHSFHVRMQRHQATSCESGLWMPYFQAGAYTAPIDVSQSADHTTCAASTAIILHTYATTFNETGQRSWSCTGAAVVPLGMLIMALERAERETLVEVVQNRDNDAESAHNHPLLKGHINITNVRIIGLALRAPTRYDIIASEARMEETAKLMSALIDRGMHAFFGKEKCGAFLTHQTRTFLRPFHCPEFRTERQPLPASAYAMLMPCGDTDVPYYEQLVEIALARSALTRAQATRLGQLALSGDGLLHERYAFASVAVRSMSAFALSQCYLDDFLNRNVAGAGWQDKKVEGDEDFKIQRLCKADDCEGAALEVHMHVRALARAPEALVAQMSPLLQLIRQFVRRFVPVLTLGAVTNKKMTAAELDQSSVMAHTFPMLIPFWQLYNASSVEARVLLKRTRFYAERRDELEAWGENSEWTTLIGEGTAPIDPAMRALSTYYTDDTANERVAQVVVAARRRLTTDVVSALCDAGEENVSTDVIGAPDVHGPQCDYSPFYKYPVSFATPEFADLRTLDWAFVYKRDSESGRTFGVEFRDVMYPTAERHADVIPFVDISEEEARTIDAVLLDQQPVPVLQLAPAEWRSAAEEQFGAAIEQIKARERAPELDVKGTVLHPRHAFLTLRAEDITNTTVAALRRIEALPQVFSFRTRWWTLNAAVDGTEMHNAVLDVYLKF